MGERVVTRDIRKTLEEYAEQLGCPISELDFEIISAELVGPEEGRYFFEAEIEINLRLPGIISIFDCKVDVEEGKRLSTAFLKVLPTFKMEISEEQFSPDDTKVILNEQQKTELIKETKKLLYLEGVIYGHYSDERLINGWEKALYAISMLKKPYRFEVAKGKPPKDPYRREIYHIPLITPAGKIINERTGRIDFKDRGYTEKKVLAGEKFAVIEFFPGEYGITVKGVLIPFKELSPLPFEVDEETIEVRERHKGDRIIYELVAKKEGFLFIEKGRIGISEYVKEKRVDYSTGDIVFEDRGVDIEVVVEGDKSVHDAIRDGFKLISPGKTVIVKGNVGRRAVVEGEQVIIEGTVAKDAVVKARICKVKTLMDSHVYAEKAFVESAVGANVEAEEAYAYTLSGATVRGRRIIALKALRHSRIYAHDFICVEEAKDFNQLIIKAEEVPSVVKEIEELEKLKKELEGKKAALESNISKLEKKIEGQLNLMVSYLRPSLKENALRLKGVVKGLLDNEEKLNSLKEKFPPHVRSVVEDAQRSRKESAGEREKLEEVIKELKEIEARISALKEKEGQVLVLDRLEQDNLIMMKKHRIYHTGTLKGPVLFCEKGGAAVEERDPEAIGELIKRHLDEDYFNLFRDYLLEKGLRSYVVKLNLSQYDKTS